MALTLTNVGPALPNSAAWREKVCYQLLTNIKVQHS